MAYANMENLIFSRGNPGKATRISKVQIGILYHARTYDAQTGRFMQTDPVHTDRAGYDGYDRYQYVNDDPVNNVDPTGKSWLSNQMYGGGGNKYLRMFNQASGHLMKAGNYKNVGNTVSRITRGTKYNDSHNIFDMAGRKIGEAGTFARHMFSNSDNFQSVFLGAYDVLATSIHNKKLATVSYHNGGFAVHDSVMAKWHGVSYTGGMVAHLHERNFEGGTKATMKHEFGHIHQNVQGGGLWDYGSSFEWDNDVRSGTMRYSFSNYIFYVALGGRDAHANGTTSPLYEAYRLMNGIYDPVAYAITDPDFIEGKSPLYWLMLDYIQIND